MDKKYLLNSNTDLENFKKIYDIDLKIDSNKLADHTAFVQVETASNGCASFNLSALVYYYLIALIPNNELKGVNLDAWKFPSTVSK